MSARNRSASPSPTTTPEQPEPESQTGPAVETSPQPPTSPLFQPTSPPPLDTTPTGASSETPNEPPNPHELGDDSASPRPSTGSSSRARLRGLRESIKGAVLTAGGLAHQLLTRENTPERDAGLYLPDDDDVKAVSEPLAGLASRRLPEGASNPDVTDLIGLVVGLAGYAIKQQLKRAELAKLRYLGDDQDPADQADDESPVDV